MNTVFADLHLHSNFSDGTYTPEEVADHAHRHGLGAIALTDHDSVEGCARAAAACARHGIEFIPASEITTEQGKSELHLLGYFLDINHVELRSELAKYQQIRQDRIREIVKRLNDAGVPLQVDAVFALANCQSPGRPHVGRALMEAGLCRSVDDAFERYLKRHRPGWVPKPRMSAAGAIQLIHAAGGLAVMAHPGISHSDKVIPDLVAAGLDGIECFHTKHSTNTSEHYLQMADHFGLVATGGSDCHGMTKGKPLIGTMKLPYDFVERLKIRRAKRHSQPPVDTVSLPV